MTQKNYAVISKRPDRPIGIGLTASWPYSLCDYRFLFEIKKSKLPFKRTKKCFCLSIFVFPHRQNFSTRKNQRPRSPHAQNLRRFCPNYFHFKVPADQNVMMGDYGDTVRTDGSLHGSAKSPHSRSPACFSP